MDRPKQLYVEMINKLRNASSLEEYREIGSEYFSARMKDLNKEQPAENLEDLKRFLSTEEDLGNAKELIVREDEVNVKLKNSTVSFLLENGQWKYNGNAEYNAAWAHIGEY